MSLTIRATALNEWATNLITSWGYGVEDARYIADTLVDANLRGVDSHGVMRLPAYYERIRQGLIDPTASVNQTSTGATAHISADGVAGQLAAREAVATASALAAEFGVGIVGVSHSAHFGAAGYFARALAETGHISLVASNSEPLVVPFGGKRALLGTNPLAIAAPTQSGVVSVDMATSQAAMGKVLGARLSGENIPPDWGVDENGLPTSDPHQVQALLPAGGPKGYALGFFVEMLSAVLTGAAMSHDVGNMYTDFDKRQNVGHFFLALSVNHFMPRERFEARAEDLIGLAHAVEPADSAKPVLVPGEPESIMSELRKKSGIPLSEGVVTELSDLGESLGVPWPHDFSV